MTHPAYLLARLNAKNARFDIGSGGTPELTPSMIAGAIALVPAGLGRELLCRLWWPDGAQLSESDIDQLLCEAQLGEWRERMDAMVTAQLAVAYAENQPLAARQRAGNRLDAARARMWPRIGPGSCYADIRRAVLAEMTAECLCEKCGGRGFILASAKIVICGTCKGGGRVRISNRQRAKAIGRDESTYREIWHPVYEWTLHLCEDVLEPAEKAFGAAVS
jgi:hypothetical protein